MASFIGKWFCCVWRLWKRLRRHKWFEITSKTLAQGIGKLFWVSVFFFFSRVVRVCLCLCVCVCGCECVHVLRQTHNQNLRFLRVCVPGTCSFTSCPLSLNNWSQSVRAKPEPLTGGVFGQRSTVDSLIIKTQLCLSTSGWSLRCHCSLLQPWELSLLFSVRNQKV